jgi:hypothetical protein
MTTTKHCKACQLDKPLDEFPPQRRTCRACYRLSQVQRHHATKHDPDRVAARAASLRRYDLRTNFGVSLDDYEAMHKAQAGLCAICLEPDASGLRLAVDHCHDARHVRGLLCGACNRGIGLLKHDPARMRRAIEYLTKP